MPRSRNQKHRSSEEKEEVQSNNWKKSSHSSNQFSKVPSPQDQTGSESIQRPISLDPANSFINFGSRSNGVQALMKAHGIKGSQRKPCHWSPITCIQWNTTNFDSWPAAVFDMFNSWSRRRVMVVKKPGDKSTGKFQKLARTQEIIPTLVVVFLRKVPHHGSESNHVSASRETCSDNQSQSETQSQTGGDFSPDESSGSNGRSGGGCGGGCRDHCKRKKPICKCRPSCCPKKCGSNDGTSLNDWTDFGWVQEEIIIVLYNVRVLATQIIIGAQCQNREVAGCSPCGSGVGLGPLNPLDMAGGAGQVGANEWEVSGKGKNFPHHPDHLSSNQLYLEYSYANYKWRLRNPWTECVYSESQTVIPW